MCVSMFTYAGLRLELGLGLRVRVMGYVRSYNALLS